MIEGDAPRLPLSDTLSDLNAKGTMIADEPEDCESLPCDASALKICTWDRRRGMLKRPYLVCSITPRPEVSPRSDGIHGKPQVSISALQAVFDKQQFSQKLTKHLLSLVDEPSLDFKEFQGRDFPEISLQDYVERIVRYAERVSYEETGNEEPTRGMNCAMMAAEYLERLNVGIPLLAMHRLFMCATLVAIKFTDDFRLSNIYWSKVAGVEVDELNKLEIRFSMMIGWRFNYTPEDHEAQRLRFSIFV